jgi:hypothetical protein
MRMGVKTFIAVFLVWTCSLSSYGGEHDRELCAGNFTNLYQWPVVQIPKRVLLIPLLRKKPDTNESERWPEQPAAYLANFYRRQFQAEVVLLRNVRTWDDYYREVNRLLLQQAILFDRVILIGHGGFDGPVLTKAVIQQNLTIKGSEGNLTYATESQPGKQQIFSLTYDISKNKIFSAYISGSWRNLVQMDDAAQRLYEMKNRLQPMNAACFDRYCAPLQSAPAMDEADKHNKMNNCRYICREPLFFLKSQEEIAPERFFLFARSLRSLARRDGLVFFGECNPGAAIPGSISEWDHLGWLVQSKLVGGPYKTYVHMFADASDRIAAGPIGKSSADDIVKRLITLETNGHQHNLCIAAPGSP